MVDEEEWRSDRYSSGDDANLLRLLNKAAGDGGLTPGFLEWQLRQGPGGAAAGVLARNAQSGDVIGSALSIPIGVRLSGKAVTGGLTLEPALDPDHHGKAIPASLVSGLNSVAGVEEYAFSYAFPSQAALSSFDQAGFREVATLPFLIRPLNPERLATKTSGGGVLARRAIARLVWRTPPPTPHHERLPGLEIEQVEEYDEPFALFWHRVQNQCPIMVTRDPAYLNWRYVNVPGREYSVFVARSEGKVRGLIAVRVAPWGRFLVGFIVDLLAEASGEGRAAGRILIDHAMAALKESDLDMMACLALRHTDEYRILKSSGFWAPPRFLEPRPLRFVVRAHDPKASAVYDLRKWFLTLGDTQIV